jgi:hypothetical protein
VVCISSISPITIGCFICVNISLVIVFIDISSFIMSGGIFFKMLVLRINEMVFAFPLKFKSLFLIFYLQDQYFIELLKPI